MASRPPRCPWYGPTPNLHDQLHAYLKEHTMTAYHDRLTAGDYTPEKPKAEPKAEATAESTTPKPKRSTRRKKTS